MSSSWSCWSSSLCKRPTNNQNYPTTQTRTSYKSSIENPALFSQILMSHRRAKRTKKYTTATISGTPAHFQSYQLRLLFFFGSIFVFCDLLVRFLRRFFLLFLGRGRRHVELTHDFLKCAKDDGRSRDLGTRDIHLVLRARPSL